MKTMCKISATDGGARGQVMGEVRELEVAHGGFRPFLVNSALRDILKIPRAKRVAIFAAPGVNAER